MTTLFYKAVILHGEIWRWSLLGLKGLNHFRVVIVFVVDTDAPPVIVKEETEAGEFVAEINKLRAHGGGDCPEYTFKGMLEALYQDPAWGSPMYVFTDAGPKDATEYDIEEVKALASADEYGVTINFFTTGRIPVETVLWVRHTFLSRDEPKGILCEKLIGCYPNLIALLTVLFTSNV